MRSYFCETEEVLCSLMRGLIGCNDDYLWRRRLGGAKQFLHSKENHYGEENHLPLALLLEEELGYFWRNSVEGVPLVLSYLQ